MKILYVHDTMAQWGGIQRIFADKMNCLAAMPGYEVCMLTYNQGSHELTYRLDSRVLYEDLQVLTHLQYRYHGLRRLWERWKRNRRLAAQLKRRINEMSPDIIVSSTSYHLQTLLRLNGTWKLIVESHIGFGLGDDHKSSDWKSRLRDRKLLSLMRRADVLVTITKGDAEQWRKYIPRVETIPNIVSLNTTGDVSDCTSKQVVFVARLTHQKAIPDLLRIWHLVNSRYPDWQLAVYGEGPEQETLQKAIGASGDNIVLHSPVSNIHDVYRASSILLMTSYYEAFGLVLAEAMSCGIPVVAFDSPYGPAEIITDGTDGFLVRNRNVEEYARRVCQLIADAGLRKQMGEAAVRSSQRFASEKIMPLWTQLFENLMKK